MKPARPIPGPDSQPGISLPALLALRTVQVIAAGGFGLILLTGAIALRILTR